MVKNIKKTFLGLAILAGCLCWVEESQAFAFKGLRARWSNFWKRAPVQRQETSFNKVKTDYDFFRKNGDGSTTLFSRTKSSYSVTTSTSGFHLYPQNNQNQKSNQYEPTYSNSLAKPIEFIDANFQVLEKAEPKQSINFTGRLCALFKKK